MATITLGPYDAGDLVELFLDVDPAGDVEPDATTSARVELHDPAGELRSLTGTPTDGTRVRWRALLADVIPGEYLGRWIVTGTGAGVQPVTVLVGPAAGAAPTGRSYATTGHLVDHTGQAPPAGARRLLVRASALVDELLRCAVYDVDEDGMPTEEAVAAALREATCAQVEWWGEQGDDTGTGAAERWTSVRIGNVQLGTGGTGRAGGGDDGGSSTRYAPAAVRALSLAGLLSGRPQVCPR